jgi:hypothetical protein
VTIDGDHCAVWRKEASNVIHRRWRSKKLKKRLGTVFANTAPRWEGGIAGSRFLRAHDPFLPKEEKEEPEAKLRARHDRGIVGERFICQTQYIEREQFYAEQSDEIGVRFSNKLRNFLHRYA